MPYTLQRYKDLSFAESVVNDPDWEFYLNGELVDGTALELSSYDIYIDDDLLHVKLSSKSTQDNGSDMVTVPIVE